MKVKITQPGWDSYTGDLLNVPFVNGVSQSHITRHDAMRLGAQIHVLEVNDDGDELGIVSPTHEMLRTHTLKAETPPRLMRQSEIDALAASAVHELMAPDDEAEAPVVVPPVVLTREDLEAVATAKGIGGLREIADRFDVKHTSIKGLISEILHAQSKGRGK